MYPASFVAAVSAALLMGDFTTWQTLTGLQASSAADLVDAQQTAARDRSSRGEAALRPEWLETKEGLTEDVPAPWTSVGVEGSHVRCWGRTYGFEQGPLPSEISAHGASVLAGPIRLTGRSQNTVLSWTGDPPRVREQKPPQAVLSGQAKAGGLVLSGETTVEYDGMIRCDLILAPSQGAAAVDELTLEIPLKPQHARYLYHFPGRWGSVANSGYLPQDGWKSPFKPFVWLGDEDRGLAWFCESDQNWFPLDNKNALTIERTPAATVLECRLITSQTRIEQPLHFTFGFQATPVKQPEKTVWDYRIVHHGSYGLEKLRAVAGGGKIVYPAADHIRPEEGTFECWYRPAVDSERQLPFAERTWQGNRELFTVELSPGQAGSNYGLYWNGTEQGLVAWARTDGVVTDNPGYRFDWKAGQWHHIGMSWDKEHLRLYLDGKLVSQSPNRGFLAAPLERAAIRIGGDGALATIDEVRILKVARVPDLADRPFEPNAETLLLDHFDNYGNGEGALEQPRRPLPRRRSAWPTLGSSSLRASSGWRRPGSLAWKRAGWSNWRGWESEPSASTNTGCRTRRTLASPTPTGPGCAAW